MNTFDWTKALKGIGAIQNIARYKSPRQQEEERQAQALAAQLSQNPMMAQQIMRNPNDMQSRALELAIGKKYPASVAGAKSYRDTALGVGPTEKKRPVRNFLQDSVLSNLGPWADILSMLSGGGS